MSKLILVFRAVCTYSSKGKMYICSHILFLTWYFPQPCSSISYLPICLTILDVRLSRSSVLMMSLRCSLITPSLEILSAELPVQEKVKLTSWHGCTSNKEVRQLYFYLLKFYTATITTVLRSGTFLTSVPQSPYGPTPGRPWPPTHWGRSGPTRRGGGSAGPTPGRCLGSPLPWPPARSSHATPAALTLQQQGGGWQKIMYIWGHWKCQKEATKSCSC